MADFTTNVNSGPTQGPSPQQPVVDRSSLNTIQAFGDIGSKVLSVGANFIQNQQTTQQQNALNQAVSGFSQKQLAIATAVDTGDISSQEGRMRMRANYTQEIANNPALTNILAQTQKQIISTAGLGSVVATGTQQEQATFALQKTAMEAGWVKPDASPSEAAAGTAAFTQFKRHQADIDAQQNQLSLDSAQIGLQRAKIGLATDRVQQVTAGYTQQSAKISLEQAVTKQRSQLAVGGMADSYFFKLNQDLDSIQQQKDAGTISPEEAIARAQASYAVVQKTVGQVGSGAGSEYVNNALAPMTTLYQASIGRLNGSLTKEISDNQVATSLAKSKMNILGDPDVSRVVATSQLLGPGSLAIIPEVTKSVTTILSKNGNGDPNAKPHDILPDSPSDKSDVGTYLNLLKSNIGGLDTDHGQNKVATENELNTNITNVLKSIDVHSVTVNNPTEYNQVTDFLASPEYGRFVKRGGGIQSEASANANTILQTQYTDKVLPLLRDEYENANIGGLTSATTARGLSPSTQVAGKPATATITPVFSGGGVMFRANDPTDIKSRNKANDLNKRVSPVVNKLIRMDAHLNGDTDYKGSYDRNFKSIFGQEDASGATQP